MMKHKLSVSHILVQAYGYEQLRYNFKPMHALHKNCSALKHRPRSVLFHLLLVHFPVTKSELRMQYTCFNLPHRYTNLASKMTFVNFI